MSLCRRSTEEGPDINIVVDRNDSNRLNNRLFTEENSSDDEDVFRSHIRNRFYSRLSVPQNNQMC